MGGIGSGKSVTIVKEIFEKSQQGHFILANFSVKGIKNFHRLRIEDIVKMQEVIDEKHPDKTILKEVVNWQFWNNIKNKYKNFSVFIDEAGNIISSRRSQSNRNRNFGIFFSQIRKILGDSKTNNLYLCNQRYKGIDKNFRDLVHYHVLTKKIEICKKCEKLEEKCRCECKKCKTRLKDCKCGHEDFHIFIVNYIFDEFEGIEFIDDFAMKHAKQQKFYANPYFKYYDSYEIVFGDEGGYL